MSDKTCPINDCGKPAENGHWWCQQHGRLWDFLDDRMERAYADDVAELDSLISEQVRAAVATERAAIVAIVEEERERHLQNVQLFINSYNEEAENEARRGADACAALIKSIRERGTA